MAAPVVGLCRRIVSRISAGNTSMHLNIAPLSSPTLNKKVNCRYCSVLSQNVAAKSRYFTPKVGCQIRGYQATTFRSYRGQLTFDTPSKSRDFIAQLMPNERQILLTELHHYQEKMDVQGGDPIGTGFHVPVQVQPQEHIDSHKNQVKTTPPTKKELRHVTISNAIPFVGFGFLDNTIMICAGDYIDVTIGAALCISTMSAAALGNLVSDLAGIGLAGYVEVLTTRLGVKAPPLTLEQLDMNITRWRASVGRAVGIVIGCILGMFPLLFLKTRQDIEEELHHKQEEEIHHLEEELHQKETDEK